MVIKHPRSKGNAKQLDLIRGLQQLGYQVSKAGQQTGRFTKEKDMFGLFDIVAMKDNHILFVQITCNKPHTHKPFDEFSKKYNSICVLKILQTVWIDRRGWKIFEYKDGEHIAYLVTKDLDKIMSVIVND